MKLSPVFNQLIRLGILVFAAVVLPSFLTGQSNNKKNNPAPAPKASAPPATQKPVQPPAQHAPAQSGAKPSTTTPDNPNMHSNQPNGHLSGAPSQPNKANPKGSGPSVPVRTPGTSTHPDGGKTVTTTAGHSLEYNKSGQLNKVVTRGGSEAHFDSQGRVSTIRTANGTTITHGPGGQRQMVTEHRDTNGHLQSRVVGMGPHGGYVEHTFQRGGHEYMRRTYVVGGRTYVNVYRGYPYRGVIYYHYIPAYYYQPVFYGWAYNPWPGPVYYNWGWYGSPWYAPYGNYFAPYPAYPSAAFWLTDYVIAENLRAAYEAGAASTAGAGNAGDAQAASPSQPIQNNSVTLTPEVKQMIAEEVKAQLAAEQAAATQGSTSNAAPAAVPQQSSPGTDQAPPALDPNLRVFIVATNLEVTADGQACSLTAGDVLMRTENTPDNHNAVGVSIVSSKKSDCTIGTSPRVQIADLQEMHNHFREHMDTGLKTLADNQGKNGIPSGPALNARQNPDGKAAEDLTATADLQKQQQDAEQAEKEVQQVSVSNGNGR
jgi:hypothetical protein